MLPGDLLGDEDDWSQGDCPLLPRHHHGPACTAVTQLADITPPGSSSSIYSTLNCDSQQTGGVCSVCPDAQLPRPTQVPPAGCGEGGAQAPHRDTARPLSLFTRSLALTVASIAVFIIPVYQREVC